MVSISPSLLLPKVVFVLNILSAVIKCNLKSPFLSDQLTLSSFLIIRMIALGVENMWGEKHAPISFGHLGSFLMYSFVCNNSIFKALNTIK